MPRKYAELETRLFAVMQAELQRDPHPVAVALMPYLDPRCVSELDVLQAWLTERQGTQLVLSVTEHTLRVTVWGSSSEMYEPPHTPSAEQLRALKPPEILAYALRAALQRHERYEAGTVAVLLPLGKPAI